MGFAIFFYVAYIKYLGVFDCWLEENCNSTALDPGYLLVFNTFLTSFSVSNLLIEGIIKKTTKQT